LPSEIMIDLTEHRSGTDQYLVRERVGCSCIINILQFSERRWGQRMWYGRKVYRRLSFVALKQLWMITDLTSRQSNHQH
jgi:hypothetical protein